jgi:hypothetical protein
MHLAETAKIAGIGGALSCLILAILLCSFLVQMDKNCAIHAIKAPELFTTK